MQYTASCELHMRDCCTNMYRTIVPDELLVHVDDCAIVLRFSNGVTLLLSVFSFSHALYMYTYTCTHDYFAIRLNLP